MLAFSVIVGSRDRRHIAFESGLEGLQILPFRVLRRQRLDPVERERKLDIDRLFHP